MKFIYNKFPDDIDFVPDEDTSWTPLKETDNLWIAQLQSLPFMFFNMAFVIAIMWLMGFPFEFNGKLMLLSFLIFMPIHEIIHALFFPESLKSNNIYLGVYIKTFALFAAYIGEMPRNRFILTLAAPLIIITIAGLVLLIFTDGNSLVQHIIVFNVMGACVDCLGIYLVLKQIPKEAMVKNKKIRTYWRL